MANIIIPPGWHIPDREATPESVYFNRRAFIKSAGLGIATAGLGACGQDFAPISIDDNQPVDGNCDANPPAHPLQTICPSPSVDLYPAGRNRVYQAPDSDLTDRLVAATYNNFYEFIGGGFGSENTIWPYVGPLTVWPWTVEVAGEAEVTGTFDVSDLEREIGLEERVYRHRCVERWSMVVPWTGYPLARLIQKFRPLSSANYVRFVGFNRPNEAVGQRVPGIYPWPYYEALRMDEALNDLAFMVTGIFGEPLPKQHGAPWRLALPWKYGFKGPKSIVRIEFMREQPPTFWPDVWSDEYGFYSNVNPGVPHPRWSQRWETPIGTEEQRATTLFNGYASQVADLYDSELLTYLS